MAQTSNISGCLWRGKVYTFISSMPVFRVSAIALLQRRSIPQVLMVTFAAEMQEQGSAFRLTLTSFFYYKEVQLESKTCKCAQTM